MDKYRELALRLKVWRKENGVTQSRLAELLGVSPSYVGFIETGRCKPSSRVIPAITSIVESGFHCSKPKIQENESAALSCKLKKWRAWNGFSRQLTADALGTTPYQISKIEKLGARPIPSLFNRISLLVTLPSADSDRLKASLLNFDCQGSAAVSIPRGLCLKQPRVRVTDEQWRNLRGQLKICCEQNGIKQVQIARALGISSGHISNIATGKSRPGRALFDNILAMLDSSKIESTKSHPRKDFQAERRQRQDRIVSKTAFQTKVQTENGAKKIFWGGDFVKQVRRLNGLTQKRLAELLGVGRLYVSKIEIGVRDLSYNTAQKIVELSTKGVIRLPENRLFKIFVEDNKDWGLPVGGREIRHPYRAFGEKVRLVRSWSGKTADEFAQDLQISVFALRLIEEGWNDASGELLLRLRDVFAADVNWLLGIEGSEPKKLVPESSAVASSDKTSKDSRSQFEEGNA